MSEEYLKTEVFVHKRDENEKILPVDVEIPEMKGKAKILPMVKGEVAKLQSEMKGTITTEQQDINLIKKHVIEPKFSDADLKAFKPMEFGHLVTAIMVGSGVPRDKIKQASLEAIKKANPLSS